ncbi:MAG: hypothetical protein C5B58_05720 [Acidobacteria bacterium]|nr:MAG: hypothetical protein C5B58_05720 [Acidobacteriota bacterium]
MDFSEPLRKLPAKISGTFWFSDEPDQQFSDELTLELDYSYTIECHLPRKPELRAGFSPDRILNKYFTLLGQDRKSQPLSLLKCGCAQLPTFTPRREITLNQITFFINVIVVGAHVTDLDQTRFQSFSVFFREFNLWTGQANLAMRIDLEALGARTLTEDDIEGFGKVGIYCGGWDKRTRADTDVSSHVRFWAPSFFPSKPLGFEELLGRLRSFQGLLTLLCGYAIVFDELRCTYLRPVGKDKRTGLSPVDVKIIPRMTGYQHAFRRSAFSLTNIPFRDLEAQWAVVLEKWFNFYDRLEDVFNLYLTVILAPDLGDDHKFLFLAQSIEGFHRARPDSKDKKFTPAEYKKRRKKVLESAPESEKEWLTDALEFPPGNTLLERIDDIMKPLKDLVADSFEDLDSFSSTVKNARNYLTHPGNTEPQSYAYRDLWKKLRTILEICFLREIGVPEKIYATVAARHRFRYD